MSDPGSPPPPPGQPPAGGPPPPPGQPQPYPGQPHPPGPPAPNYGQAYPPPPPPKKRRWPKILAAVLVGGLLFIGGCALLIWRLVSGPIDAANDFLADVAAQEYVAATEHLDPSCFGEGEVTPDALRAFFGDDVQSYDLTSVNNDNNRTGEASGTITRAGFGEQPISFAMSRPADDWLVCGFRIGG